MELCHSSVLMAITKVESAFVTSHKTQHVPCSASTSAINVLPQSLCQE